MSKRRQRAETLAAAKSRQSEWLPIRNNGVTAPAKLSSTPSKVSHRLRKTASKTSLDGVNVTLREELENRWPKVAGVKSIQSLAESKNIPFSTSDTFLAMAMGSAANADVPSLNVSDWDSVAASEVSPNDGRPYPWMDAPVEGLDSFMMY